MADVTADNLKAKAQEAVTLRSTLQGKLALARSNPKLYAEYQSVMGSFAANVSDYVQSVTGVYDDAKAAFVKLYQWALDDVDALGNPLLIVGGIAAGGAALAAMTSWVTSAYNLDARLNAYQRSLNAGATPSQAAANVAAAAGDGASQNDSIGKQVKDGVGAVVKGGVALTLIVGAIKYGPAVAAWFKNRKTQRKG